jgi:glyoxylase-like metal-dependent hydrolase (beta-lactamase superfamily II)
MLYQWLILQDGRLPLTPRGRHEPVEHVCTATLVWPADGPPSPANSLVVDPCFTASGLREATERLSARGLTFDHIGYYLESHPHYDHVLQVPEPALRFGQPGFRLESVARWRQVANDVPHILPDVEALSLAGHAPDLTALRIATAEGEVWVVADAILNRNWLTAWMFYWPNGYDRFEIAETWRSVARILATADVVIPGHGPPIRVDAGLVEELVEGFPRAKCAGDCPEVVERLRERLGRLNSI